MRDTVYLIMNRNGVREMRKNLPNVGRGEIAVRVRVEVPNTVFESCIPTVDVAVPVAAVLHPDALVEVEPPQVATALE